MGFLYFIVPLHSASPHLPPTKMAKKPIQKKSRKAAKAGGRRRKGVRTYRPYIARVLKGLSGNFKISKKAMAITNSFVEDLFERIAGEAGRLCKHTKKKTISSKAIQTACRLQLPGE